MHLRAERLDWIPALLAGSDRPFAIEQPAELRRLVRSLAEQLASYSDAGAAPPNPTAS